MSPMDIKFSEEDQDLAKLNWHRHSAGYATRWHGPRPHRYKSFAHRLVLERKIGRPLEKGELCDHINRDKLDNRRDNLRVADKSLNALNTDRVYERQSGYRGVYLHWPKESQEKGWEKRWVARVTRHRKTKEVGYYKTPEEAHKARVAYLETL